MSPAPVVDAVDDEFSLAADGQIEIVAPGVAANDRVPSAERARISLLTPPSHGALKLGATGEFVYIPVKGFTGTDTFRYALSNGSSKDEAVVVLQVFGQVDVALTATVSPAHVPPGQAAVVTFQVVNEGPSTADSVKIEVKVPARGTGTEVRPDGRCTPLLHDEWSCAMGALPIGSFLTASFSITPRAPGAILATGTAVAANDANPRNDNATAVFDAGRLSLDPGHVTVRLPWSAPGRPAEPYTLEAAIANETVAPLTYQAQVLGGYDVPPAWLALHPAAGTVDPMSGGAVKVVFSPAGVVPGLHRAGLHFVHDGAFAFEDTAVSFTVAFRDVPAERKDDPYIHALAGAGVTAGCRDGAFCPDQPLTRAGASVWLLLSSQGAAYQPPPARGMFGDVSMDRPDAGFIEDAASRGVLDACANDPAFLFCPDRPLSRADAAVAVLKTIEGPDYAPPLVVITFRDLVRDPRAMFVEDAVRRGFFTGCSASSDRDGLFCPDAGLKRGDAAVALVKAFSLPLF
jgi:hypothetical protein